MKDFRQDFPLLAERINGKPIVYFDNACSTLRPRQVIDAMDEYYQKYSACAGRSAHVLGETVTRKVDEARTAIAKHFGARKKEEIVFTRNTTEGINLVARSFPFEKGDVVLVSDKEHNSNLIPWQIAAKHRGIVLKIIPSNPDNTFNLDSFRKILNEGRVKMVALGYTSNLDGVTLPIEDIIPLAHAHNAYVLLDAAQAAPHRAINASALDIDFLSCSGHKMLGPSGTGVLYGKYQLLEMLEPFIVGGETVAASTYTTHEMLPPPDKFEAGLQDYAGIIGLGEAVQYLERVGFEHIAAQERELNTYITDAIADIKGLRIIGPADPALRGGIVNFTIQGIDPHQIALLMSQANNVMIRSGQHCVHSWFAARGIKNSARASLYFYNTMEEARTFVDGLKQIVMLHS